MPNIRWSLVLAITLIVGCKTAPKEYDIRCTQCGSEYTSTAPGDVSECPNCPMSDEELDALIDQIEKARR